MTAALRRRRDQGSITVDYILDHAVDLIEAAAERELVVEKSSKLRT